MQCSFLIDSMKYLLTLLLFVSLNVFSEISEEWFLIDKEDNGQEIYFNLESVEIDETKRRFWVLTNLSDDVPKYSQKSYNSYQEIDCKKKTMLILQATFFSERDLKGENLNTETDYKSIYIAPNTINDGKQRLVCKVNK